MQDPRVSLFLILAIAKIGREGMQGMDVENRCRLYQQDTDQHFSTLSYRHILSW